MNVLNVYQTGTNIFNEAEKSLEFRKRCDTHLYQPCRSISALWADTDIIRSAVSHMQNLVFITNYVIKIDLIKITTQNQNFNNVVDLSFRNKNYSELSYHLVEKI